MSWLSFSTSQNFTIAIETLRQKEKEREEEKREKERRKVERKGGTEGGGREEFSIVKAWATERQKPLKL